MRITVCELPDDPDQYASAWAELVRHVRAERSELLVLPEMPFSRWFCAEASFDAEVWGAAERDHAGALSRLAELAPAAVVVSAPVSEHGIRRNRAMVVHGRFRVSGHAKRHLPDEAGFWEARWYDASTEESPPIRLPGATLAIALCTELWMFEQSRRAGLAGADVLAVPRATPSASRDRWLVAGRAAAISAGAFCLSSNRSGSGASVDFAGCGWVIDPDGEVVALTSEAHPFVTRGIDLQHARAAKSTYPRYALRETDILRTA